MNDTETGFSWKGFAALIILLLIVSIVAFIISSIEGFITGVVAVFMGFLLSFFRDDIKRMLGLSDSSSKAETPMPTKEESKQLAKLEKYVAKRREKIAKAISKFESKETPKKRRKIAQEIVELATSTIFLIDQIKSQAILLNHPQLMAHYEKISQEIEMIKARYIQYC
ncbi:MAG: hypothetical protein BAJATHORv1_20273 [Candidatus Thorarchaeota archaeon]|nr:MAG: hypothetical protein BAJATHORv1_20273 [Candidatus Thorarchaeota archaeon]